MTPRVVILTAPSGGGKTTIVSELLRRRADLFGYSVSATTRRPRVGETDGAAYHFLARDAFERRVQAGDFLEWAEYAGERYGTLKSEVERILAAGRHAVLDIEVQGARQVRKVYPRPASVSIFVVAPSPRVLIERLRQRRTESEQQLRARLAIAVREVETARADLGTGAVFDAVLVNDDLEKAVDRLVQLVGDPDAARQRSTGMAALLADFVRGLEVEAERLSQSARSV